MTSRSNERRSSPVTIASFFSFSPSFLSFLDLSSSFSLCSSKRAKTEDGSSLGLQKAHEIGSKVWVRWRDGGFQQAEVIDRKEKEQRPAKKADKGGGDKGAAFEYYVHYVEFNRRLDEWIAADKIVSEEEALKRKDKEGGGAGGGAGGAAAGKDGREKAGTSSSSSAAAADDHDDHHHAPHDEDGMPERKLTRKMKRQHDEINHIQRVTATSSLYQLHFQHGPELFSSSSSSLILHCSLWRNWIPRRRRSKRSMRR